jgi:hypothetical protein
VLIYGGTFGRDEEGIPDKRGRIGSILMMKKREFTE